MLESALDIPAAPKAPAAGIPVAIRRNRAAFSGYSLLVTAIVAGWLLREKTLLNPEEGLGYWLGIIGATLMLLLLLYPAGKKSSILRRLGLVRHWFRIHMIMGLLGPSLVLYHCNFSVDSMNSKVALYSMLGVAVSGIIGRYFYTRIHRGLYGRRARVEELRAEIADSLENSRGLAAILPRMINELHTVSAELMGEEHTRAISIRQCLSWTITYYFMRVKLYFAIRRELHARSVVSNTVLSNTKNLQKTANAYATRQLGLMRQVAQLSFYERLFSLWHIFHMPLFLLLVVSALVHVLAVHMY